MAIKTHCDRLSNLPDHLIHHIYSFFNEDEMIHMMIVSKRLRNLCLSSSSMAFAAYHHHPSSSALDFHNFIEDCAVSSASEEDICMLSLCLTWRRGKQGRLLNCIRAIPQSNHLSSLQTLVLRYFKLELFGITSLGELISSSFPSLKKLVIYFEDCVFITNQPLIVTCPSLREIQVSGPENLSFDRDFCLKISCSSLEHLTIKNFLFKDAIFEIIILGEQLQTLYLDRVEFIRELFVTRTFFQDICPKVKNSSLDWKSNTTIQGLKRELPFIGKGDVTCQGQA